MKTKRRESKAYITKDGSEIRELLHPDQHGVNNQSLAEATIPAGITTHLHRHIKSEEIYHVTAGCGVMQLGHEQFEITAGDSIAIPPGTAHNVFNPGSEELVILCCCAPAYAHDDTELL